MRDEWIDIEGTIIAVTDAAILLDDGDTEAWIPRSQLRHNFGFEREESVVIEIPEWLAEDKGFI